MNTIPHPNKPDVTLGLAFAAPILLAACQKAVAMIEERLGDDVGVDTPHMSKEVKFLNELRYTLLEAIPMNIL